MSKIYNKTIIFLLICLFTSMNFTVVRGNDDVNIISDTEVTASQAKAWAESKGATDTFIALADLYWKYSSSCGNVNPAVAYAQAALETGYGRFGDNLDATWKNPCGLKISAGGGDYDANAHNRFGSWSQGVQAHLDHLALYAGADGYPKKDTYDTRHFANLLGKCKTVVSLGGNWAPSKSYGSNVFKLYNEILKTKKNYTGNACIRDGCKEDEDIYENIGILDMSSKESSGNSLTVSGWALNKSGINEVKIFINDKYIKSAKYGLERKDIAKKYSYYPGAISSGYSADIDITDISEGNVKLKVVFICKDGSQFDVNKDIFINKNGLTMELECPIDGESINDEDLVIMGWALSKEKIKSINIYIDDKLIGEANYGVERDDVLNTHKEYNNINCGFSAIVSMKDKKTDTLKLKVESVSESGVKTWKEININNYYKNNNYLLFDNKVIKNIITLNKLGDTIRKISFKQMCIEERVAEKSKIKLDNLSFPSSYVKDKKKVNINL